MHKCKVNTRTGTDKNGDQWYGFTITVEDFTTKFEFVDKIHYEYLKKLETPDNSVQVKSN